MLDIFHIKTTQKYCKYQYASCNNIFVKTIVEKNMHEKDIKNDW
jgi:hypothetical protein